MDRNSYEWRDFLNRRGRAALALLLIVFLLSCAGGKKAYDPQTKFSPAQLQEDAAVLWQTFSQCHPSLYWFNPKEIIDPAFENLPSLLQDSLTEAQFRNVLAREVALIRCGHTSIRPSKRAARYRENTRRPFFPLQVKTWRSDSMIILSNLFRNDSILVRGTSIQTINGLPVGVITDSICRFISADGLHNNFRYQLISNNFPAWYKSIFGLSDTYTLAVTRLNGKKDTVVIKNFDPRHEDSLTGRRNAMIVSRPSQKPRRLEEERRLVIDTARNLAIMELNTFSHAQLPHFFRKTFRQLKEQQVKNLVIELRENGGGNIINSTRLSRYIAAHKFKVADTVAAKSFKYPYPAAINTGFIYRVQSWFVTSKKSDGRYHYKMYERKYFKPYTKHHFDGNVFILTGGFTFSASTLFINPLIGQPNVKIVGEETGGGAYGNTAVNVPDITLPNTGVRVRLPLYRLVANKDLERDGRGIIPDIIVPPSSWFLAKRIDPKMAKVYELIAAQKN